LNLKDLIVSSASIREEKRREEKRREEKRREFHKGTSRDFIYQW